MKDPAPISTKKAASELVQGIRASFNAAWSHYEDGCRQLVDAYRGRAWEPLGLKDWDAFVRHTLDVDHLRIPRVERTAIVEALTAGGLSIRAIAVATGLSVGTVHGELAPVRSELNTPTTVTIPATIEEAVEQLNELNDQTAAIEKERRSMIEALDSKTLYEMEQAAELARSILEERGWTPPP
jgi:hypothetical protein